MLSEQEYARVYLLDLPYAADRAFDYYIPSSLRSATRRGCFVTVPFGKGNRQRLGVVTEFTDRTELAASMVKPLLSVCEARLSLSEEMLGLCFYMKEQTLCSFGDAVHALIPSAAMSRLRDVYRLTDTPISPALQSNETAVAVHRELTERGAMTEEALCRKFGKDITAILKKMEHAGLILRETQLQAATNEKKEYRYAFALPTEDIEALIAGEIPPSLKGTLTRKLNEKQREVLKTLALMDRPGEAELIAESGSNPAQLKTLTERGILTRAEERIDRNPYAAASATHTAPVVLNEEQNAAYETLRSLFDSGDPHAALLHGVTGSGKTSVMLRILDRVLEAGRCAIVLLPEIALTPQSLAIFCARYGDRVAVIHSGLSAGERFDAYTRIREGRADVVVGTRSAVFAPVRDLGLIVMDEEQEHTYKSDMDPKYHARDVARYRCAHANALLLLASATPSLESYHKAKAGKYTLLTLKHRYGDAELPDVTVADMRPEAAAGNLSPLGQTLTEELQKTAARGEQSILFLNRRGYNAFVSCRSCGEAIKCPHCSVSLTYHTAQDSYERGSLVCHWCGYRTRLPEVCPSCSSPHLARMGYGTQRVEQELGILLPESRILRMDTDTTSAKFSYDKLLGSFRRREADVLLGTQMVTKGHDFPEVTLVGVLLADASLYLDDYRASEKTFAMLTQVIGRAGRAGKAGHAVIQTNNPDNDVIRLACAQDYETFYEREIKLRKLLVFPPFCDIVLMTLTCSDERILLEASAELRQMFDRKVRTEFSGVKHIAFGPFEAPVYRVDNKYRMRMIVKCVLNRESRALFASMLSSYHGNTSVKPTLSIDFNPSSL
ncbi:MAG: primosomal protein N' [Clostridia bacterium]|nr:primosomal protein N' [Clostridia bacterium]